MFYIFKEFSFGISSSATFKAAKKKKTIFHTLEKYSVNHFYRFLCMSQLEGKEKTPLFKAIISKSVCPWFTVHESTNVF